MVKSENLLPKRLVGYIHEMGVRALDHLADTMERPLSPQASGEQPASPGAVHALIDRWTAMTTEQKEEFVEKVAASVIEVVAASAALPFGLKLGKQAAKATKKVLKRKTKKFRKIARRTTSSIAAEPKRSARNQRKENEKSAPAGRPEVLKDSRRKKPAGTNRKSRS